MPRLTIALAAFNEEACVEKVVREAIGIIGELDGDGEVLVVNDGSTDRTPEILARLCEEHALVRVVTHEHNRGIGGFNRSMLREARGDWVLFTSADGEYDPREGLRFLDIAEHEGADAVLGYRADKHYDGYRRIVSWSFNSLTYLCFGARFKDIGSTRLLRRSLFQPIALHSQSAFINAERLLAGKRAGARIVEVPTRHRPRLAGRGGGAKPRKVIAALRDLLATRARWFISPP